MAIRPFVFSRLGHTHKKVKPSHMEHTAFAADLQNYKTVYAPSSSSSSAAFASFSSFSSVLGAGVASAAWQHLGRRAEQHMNSAGWWPCADDPALASSLALAPFASEACAGKGLDTLMLCDSDLRGQQNTSPSTVLAR